MTAAPPSPLSAPSPAGRPRPGLRERKKARTREAIRAAAYGLIREQGYDTITVEQIADRAEVSPSTVFRYFPVKEDIVLTDAYDPLLLEGFRARPADEPWPVSVRCVMREVIVRGVEADPEAARLRTRLMSEVPAVRSRMLESTSVTGRLLARAIAARTGLDPEGVEVRVLSASLVACLVEVSRYWAEHGHEENLADLAERALDVLEHGLPASGKA
ncbi:TetR/AcrR family transcriptional regulator [Streptomyces sp. NPDC093586]|uniref:TetR/AcrR family transcriptional regulator n=1 Tax=Streptomyces sp. NPDC093586 TaxID=3366042 RepID=UPI003806471B